MSKRKVCVIVTARPSYARVKTALQAIEEHSELELQLVLAGSALLNRYGNAAHVIEKDGFEVAEKIIYKNGYSGTVNVVNKNSTDLIVGKDLPRKADVVISEILSAEFVGEGVRSTIFDANNRLLDENGRMIPESGNIMIALLGDNAEIINKVSVDNVNGFDLSKFNSITSTKFSFHLSKTPKFLSKAEVAFKLNLYDKQKVSRKELILTLIAQEAGICVGVIQWMKIQLKFMKMN